MRNEIRVLSVVMAMVFVFGIGMSAAQDKPAGQEKPAQTEAVAATDPSGDWDGSVETPNGTITFGLTLTVEKDKVTGQIGSPEGSVPIAGTWADGKLTASFDYNGTPITVNGALKDGALAGDMLYGGQTAMPFTAKRRVAK